MLSSGLKPPPPLAQKTDPSHVFRAPIPLCGAFFQNRRSTPRVHILFHSHYFPATSARYNTPYTRLERGHAAWRSEFSLWRRSVCWASCCCPPQTNRRKPYPWPSVQTAPQRTMRPLPDSCFSPNCRTPDITGIRIHANDDCEFDFSVRGELSVNGQKGR